MKYVILLLFFISDICFAEITITDLCVSEAEMVEVFQIKRQSGINKTNLKNLIIYGNQNHSIDFHILNLIDVLYNSISLTESPNNVYNIHLNNCLILRTQ